MGYTNSPTGYANPDAVTQIANGLSTSTFSYDNDGNLTQKTVDGTTTTYVYDYANRLTALGVSGATTTYGYDAFGARVLQTGTTTTTFYPFKSYSVASSTGTGAKYSTTTSYMFNGDTLLATVDQQLASGVATGTAKTRYIHPDHLGSTNVVTDENDNLVQTLDYFPYGATRVSVATSTNEKRKFIDQFSDDSGLSYLNARYYNPGQGQFISEDPLFVGDARGQTLQDPQSLNAYSYSEDDPIAKTDPSGKITYDVSRPVDPNNYILSNFSHAFLYVVPSPGEDLPSIDSNGMCIDTALPFTLSGFPDSQFLPHLTTVADNSYDYSVASANESVLGTERVLVSPPSGLTTAQLDRNEVLAFKKPNGL